MNSSFGPERLWAQEVLTFISLLCRWFLNLSQPQKEYRSLFGSLVGLSCWHKIMHGIKLPQSERRKKQKGPFVKEIWWWFKQIKAVVRWGFFQLGSRTWQLLTCTWTRLKDGAFAAAARDFGAAFPFNDFFHLVWNPLFLQRGNWAHAGCSEARPTLANMKLHPEASWWTQWFVLLWIWLEAEALNSSDYCWLSLAC